jgi:serine/threonine-protein kinase HipA
VNGTPRLAVFVARENAGVLSAERPDRFVFTYDPACPPARFVSLTMPVRLESYVWHELHPVFQMSLPEGDLLARLRSRLAKTGAGGPVHLLAIIGSEMIGRLSVFPEGTRPDAPIDAQSFAALMTAADTRPLFTDLVEQHLARGVSGVMPKAISVSREKEGERLTAFDGGGIYKMGNDDFPDLARNEWHCLSAARKCGLDVPEFELSRDGRVLRIARFDRSAEGPLGFEDACVLLGLGTAQKYDSTCERLVGAVATFSPALARPDVRREMFRRLLISHMLRNGDAHLKNFGVLYRTAADVRLAPVYDIVTTTAYRALRNDVPALTLAGRRAWRLKPGSWTRFAQQHCGLDPEQSRQIAYALAAKVRAEAAKLSRPSRGRGAGTLAAMHDQWSAGIEDALAGL